MDDAKDIKINFWHMAMDDNASSMWKALLSDKDKLAANFSREITSGKDTDL